MLCQTSHFIILRHTLEAIISYNTVETTASLTVKQLASLQSPTGYCLGYIPELSLNIISLSIMSLTAADIHPNHTHNLVKSFYSH